MECATCGAFTAGDRCGNPGCPGNQMSQYDCPTCGSLSPGVTCGNPACPTYDAGAELRRWQAKLDRSRFDGLTWGELLDVLDGAVVEYIQGSRVVPNTAWHHGSRWISYPMARNWLWLCSDKAGPRLNWVPATLLLRPYGFPVRVELRGQADARVKFPPEVCGGREDLRYFEIGRIFQLLGNPAIVATEMLDRVLGVHRVTFGPAYDGFLDAMIVLLFGVESGRNWATCATSLMLLELIAHQTAYGHAGIKRFDLAGAFHHRNDKRWPDDALYGGKHPMATHGTGPGNLTARGSMVRLRGVGWDLAMVTNPQHHSVVFRELNVLRHWLELSLTRDEYEGLDVRGRILRLLQTYFPPPPPHPY